MSFCTFGIICEMAVLGAEEIQMAMQAGSPDLKFLFDREGIKLDIQAAIFNAGVLTMRQFAAMFESSEDLRKIAKDELNVDPAASLANRVLVSKMIVAWESAKVRSGKMAEAEADSELRQEAKPIKGTDFHAILKAWEERWWKLEDEEVPARAYVEKIAEGIEKAEPRAEMLSEVASKLEGDTNVLRAIWDPSGNMKAVKATPTVPQPRDPEELRARVALLGRAWAMVGLLQPNSKILQDTSPQTWTAYLDYLLGPHVYKLNARDEYGSVVAAPPWSLILSYEHEIRRKMVKLMGEGVPLATALKRAWTDPVVKERYFTTPLALGATARKRSAKEAFGTDHDEPSGRGPKGGKGKGKYNQGHSKKGSGSKGKGKGKQPRVCATSTPNGKLICLQFNSMENPCTRRPCRYQHVCGKCFKDHAMWQCKS